MNRRIYEEPQVPNFKQRNRGPKLAPGMTLAIEPMVNAGRMYTMDNDWTVVTEDGPSAH